MIYIIYTLGILAIIGSFLPIILYVGTVSDDIDYGEKTIRWINKN